MRSQNSARSVGFFNSLLTVKLRGRPEAPTKPRGRTLSSRARGADMQAVHGPLQRLLERTKKRCRRASGDPMRQSKTVPLQSPELRARNIRMLTTKSMHINTTSPHLRPGSNVDGGTVTKPIAPMAEAIINSAANTRAAPKKTVQKPLCRGSFT